MAISTRRGIYNPNIIKKHCENLYNTPKHKVLLRRQKREFLTQPRILIEGFTNKEKLE